MTMLTCLREKLNTNSIIVVKSVSSFKFSKGEKTTYLSERIVFNRGAEWVSAWIIKELK